MMTSEQDVYVLKNAARYKIGIANNIDKRIRQLQTGNPNPILMFCRFETEDADRAETWLHERYKASRIAGEWFRLTRKQILELQIIEENECLDLLIEYAQKHGDITYEEIRDLDDNLSFFLIGDSMDEQQIADFCAYPDTWDIKERAMFPENYNADGSHKKNRIYDKGCPLCVDPHYPSYIQPRCSLSDERMLCGECGYIWTESTLAYEILTFGCPLARGTKVTHPKFGKGKIIGNGFTKTEWGREVTVDFTNAGRKRLVLIAANLQIATQSTR